jgi:hypothetical protein
MIDDLPFDVIYKIYFHVDDYTTAHEFWILNKHFTNNYMKRYNQSYRHLFSIIFKKLFGFLSLLPHYTQHDIDFFCTFESQCQPLWVKRLIKRDIIFVYYLYKEFLHTQIVWSDRPPQSAKESIVNTCLMGGPDFLDKYCTVSFNRNKVKLQSNVIHNKAKKKFLLSNHRIATYRYINTQFDIWEKNVFNTLTIS